MQFGVNNKKRSDKSNQLSLIRLLNIATLVVSSWKYD
jgi:hypothetical protein